jgi:hypothetical protein
MLPVFSLLKWFAPVRSSLKWLAPIAMIALGAGLVNIQLPVAQKRSIQSLNRGFGLTAAGHFDKCKAPRMAGVTILDESDGFDGPMRLEQATYLIRRRSKLQVADIDVVHGFLASCSRKADAVLTTQLQSVHP